MILCSEIRKRARQTVLGGSIFTSGWLFALLVFLVASAANNLLPLILYGLAYTAMCGYFTARVRGMAKADNLSVALDSATADVGGNIILGILYNIFIALWTLLFIIPGIVKACSYSMAFYIKNDNPGMSATEALTESRRMMNGYKMKYFVLHLSFIGWYILGLLCMGLGVLWVSAYEAASDAVFYEELKRTKGNDIPLYETVMGNGGNA